jgi:hypothetical protein
MQYREILDSFLLTPPDAITLPGEFSPKIVSLLLKLRNETVTLDTIAQVVTPPTLAACAIPDDTANVKQIAVPRANF